jgi:hypothetical protein
VSLKGASIRRASLATVTVRAEANYLDSRPRLSIRHTSDVIEQGDCAMAWKSEPVVASGDWTKGDSPLKTIREDPALLERFEKALQAVNERQARADALGWADGWR